MTSEPTYYSILEIPTTATDAVVRRAYRRLALKWHPDKNPDNKEEADRRFKEISEAYEILSDADKRRIYDVEGKSGISRRFNRSTTTSSTGRQAEKDTAGDRFNKMPQFHFAFRDPADVFREFFGTWNPFEDLIRQVHLHHHHTHNLHHRTPYDKDPLNARRRHYQTSQPNFVTVTPSSTPTVVNVAASAAAAAAAAATLAAQQQQQQQQQQRQQQQQQQQQRQRLQQAFLRPAINHNNTAPNLFYSNIVSNPLMARSFPMCSVMSTGTQGATVAHMTTGLQNRSPLVQGRFSSTSTRFRGGHQIVTRTVIENGQETVTIEQDGVVMSMTVNGASVTVPNRSR